MKKALVLSAVAAAMGLCAMNASALPAGWESVNFHATITVQNGNVTKQVSVSTKDLLGLIGMEFGTLPSGAQLVTSGLDDEEFTVLTKNNDVWISDASEDGNDYTLFFWPDWDDRYVDNDTKEPIQITTDNGYLKYSDSTDTYNFLLQGPTTISDNTDNANESFNMSNAAGFCTLPLGVGNDSGVMIGGLSGSGKDVDYWW